MTSTINTMIVAAGDVIPDDLVILSASMTPNGRIHLITLRYERDEIWEADYEEDFEEAGWDGLTEEDIDAILVANGMIYAAERNTEEE